MIYIHIHTTEYYSAIKKEWNFAICNNMGGFEEYYTKWNKSDWERKILYDITYMWNLKNKTDKCNKTDIENKLMDTSGEGQVRSGEWTGTN